MDKDEYPAWPPTESRPFLVEGRRTRRGGKIPLEQRPQRGRRVFPPLPPVGAAGCDRYITALSGPVFPGQEEWYRRGCKRLCLFVRQRRCLFFQRRVSPPGPWVFRRGQQRPSALFCLRRGPPRPRTPGHFFPRRKSDPKRRRGLPGPRFFQSVWIGLDNAVPLKH